MKKALSYILVVFSLFLLLEGVKASEYSCKYAKLEIKAVAPSHPDFGDFTKGTINNNTTISFKVIDGNVKRKNVTAENIPGGKEEIVNWNVEKGGFSAQKYADAEACPPYALALDDKNGQWEYFVFEKSEEVLAISNSKKNVDSTIVLKLVEGPKLGSDNTNSNDEVYGPPVPPDTSDLFTCSLNGYKIVYNTNGEIKHAAASGIQNFKSDFKPKNKNECPTEKEAKVEINLGEETFYVKTIETLSDKESANSCLDFDEKGDCEKGNAVHCTEWGCQATGNFACVWNDVVVDGKSYGYCNVDKLLYVKCGDAKDIPHQVPQIVSFAVNFLKILTPLILIFVSILTLLKAISSGNEDEMKKAQKGLIRKIIAAVMVFFVISIVQFVIAKVADDEMLFIKRDKTTNLSDCLNCFLNNKCGDSVYYKTYIGSELITTTLENNE